MMKANKHKQKKKEPNDEVVLKNIVRILDEYLDKKCTKESMIKRCKLLHKKLSLQFLESKLY